MHRRKPDLEIDDDAVNSIGDLEREILAQGICGQAARKYLDSLQDDRFQTPTLDPTATRHQILYLHIATQKNHND
ncbi:MAG: hypothetical protein U9Q37_04305 [Euryarchaeota archaeon]|nr:hypothetical protein [Euryarchaeota archaeon]